MSKCLVTGHKGYIGSHLVKELQDLGHEVVGIDSNDPDTGSIQDVLSDPILRERFEKFQPEYIFHLACWPRVEYSIDEPLKTMQNNVIAGSMILDFAKKVKCKRFIYSSSSSVVGDGNGPESPYALQKYATEIEATLYCKLYNIDTVSLRYFNVYSPGAVFDVGTGNNISLNEIKDIVLQYFTDIEFESRNSRPGDIMETKADTENLKNAGWETKVDILEGVEECFSSLREKQNV